MKYGFVWIAAAFFAVLSFEASASEKAPANQYPGVVWGVVVDSGEGAPIHYATVALLSQKDSSVVTGGITDEKGVFKIENVPYGDYILKASFIGFEKAFVSDVAIKSNSPVVAAGKIKLAASSIETETVTVEGQKDLVTYKLDRKVVNVSDNPKARGGSAAQALENVPSVRVDVEGNVSLRGSSNFTVLVDGKPTVLDGNDLLKQIPADAVESVEIITNPSAKYDPDGTSGILNIIMKKEKLSGMNGIANLTLGTREKYNGNTLFNFKSDSFNYFAGLDYNNQKYHPESNFTRETKSGDTAFFANPTMDRIYNPISYNLKTGADFYIDETNTVSISGNYGYYGFDRFLPSRYTEWTNFEPQKDYFESRDEFLVGGAYFGASSSWHKLFESKGRELLTTLSFSRWLGDVDQTSNKYETDGSFNPTGVILDKMRTYNDMGRANIRLKSDYTLPLGEYRKIETGVQSDAKWKDSDYLYEDFDEDTGEWFTNRTYTNKIDYSENTQSVYATYSDAIFETMFQVGLRGEYYRRELNQITKNENFKYDKFDIFPTLHISKELGGGDQIQLSYSRRVYRPDDRTLNPFPDYNDEYFVSQGNPYLKPQYTDSYELNFRKALGRSFASIETYYRQTSDNIQRTMTLLDDGRILLTSDNFGSDYLYGAQAEVNWSIFMWLRWNVSANYYSYHLKEISGDEENERERNIFDGNTNLTILLPTKTYVQLYGHYTGTRIIAEGEQKEAFVTGLSVRQGFLDNSLAVILNVRDIFGTGKYEFINKGINYKTTGYFQQEGPTVSLTFSYKINDYKRRNTDDSGADIDFKGGI